MRWGERSTPFFTPLTPPNAFVQIATTPQSSGSSFDQTVAVTAARLLGSDGECYCHAASSRGVSRELGPVTGSTTNTPVAPASGSPRPCQPPSHSVEEWCISLSPSRHLSSWAVLKKQLKLPAPRLLATPPPPPPPHPALAPAPRVVQMNGVRAGIHNPTCQQSVAAATTTSGRGACR
jgi:hypothetical protein